MKLLKPYYDFRGGWNTDVAPDNLQDNELIQADNAILDQRGGMEKRKGTARINSTGYSAEVERLIEWPRNDGTKILLAVVGTSLSKIAEDGTKTDLQALNQVDIGHCVYNDKFYFVDGAEYRVYDGSTVSAVTPNGAGDNDLTPIKRCDMLLWHPKSFRIFAAGDSQNPERLYYSEPNDPTYFKNTSVLTPTTGDGPITAIVVFGDAVLVFYPNSVWAWRGTDPSTDATWSKLPVGQGTVARRSIALTSNSLTFLGQGGIYAISPGILDYSVTLAPGEELVANLARNKVTKVIKEDMVHPETACALFDPHTERYMLAYGDDSQNTRNNRVLVLDWALGAFTRWTGWAVNDFCKRANGDLIFGTTDYVLKTNQGYKDVDQPIDFHVKTKAWSLDYPVHIKKIYRLFLAVKQYQTETSTIDLTVISNYQAVSVEDIVADISFDESFTWGEAWGDVWGWSDYVSKEVRIRLKGSRLQVELQNNVIDEPVTIYGVAFKFRVLKAKGVKVDG